MPDPITVWGTTCRAALAVLLFALIHVAPAASSGLERPGAEAGPTTVAISLRLLDLQAIDTVEQRFEASVFLRARWHDPRQAHGGSGPLALAPDAVWQPDLQILNQLGVVDSLRSSLLALPDGTMLWRQRLWGSFAQPLGLDDFPFDRQRLALELVSAAVGGAEAVRLVADASLPSAIPERVSIPDWTLLPAVEVAVTAFAFAPDAPPLSRFVFAFALERNSGYFVTKVIVPLILIVAMSWIVLWVDPKEVGIQISVAITTILTLIAYRFAIDATLPRISYATVLDHFILGATLLVFAMLLKVMITTRLGRSERGLALSARIDRWCRLLFPLALLLLVVQLLWRSR